MSSLLESVFQEHLTRSDNPHNTSAALADAYSQRQINALLRAINQVLGLHLDANNNPHGTTRELIGLGNVTNESKETMFNNPTFTGTVSGVTKGHVGLVNVDNVQQIQLSYLNDGEEISISKTKVASEYTISKTLSALMGGFSVKDPVKVATTEDIVLSGEQLIDTVAVVAGDEVLVWQQNNTSQNGVYTVSAGAWTRRTDMDTWGELNTSFVSVAGGDEYRGAGFYCVAEPGGILGTTGITFRIFLQPGGYTSADALVDVTMDTISDGANYKKITSAEKTNYDTAYTDRLKWDGFPNIELNPIQARSSLELDTAAQEPVETFQPRGVLRKTVTVDYDLTNADCGYVIEMNSSSSRTVFVPIGLRADFQCVIVRYGSGPVSIVGDGTTVRSPGSLNFAIAQRYAGAALYHRGSNEFIMYGDLSSII